MSDPRYELLRRTFDEVVELPAASRSSRLAELRRAEPALAEEVERLLRHSGEGDGFLSGGPRDPLAPILAAGAELAVGAEEVIRGRRVAGYRLVRVLASGGMGTVFEAEQEHPRRRVALKTLRFGAVSEDALRRFRLEAEVLGAPGQQGCHPEAGHTGKLGAGCGDLVWELLRQALRELLSQFQTEGIHHEVGHAPPLLE